jgi:hypothetical protein
MNCRAVNDWHSKGLATKAEAGKWFSVKTIESARNVIPLSGQRARFAGFARRFLVAPGFALAVNGAHEDHRTLVRS